MENNKILKKVSVSLDRFFVALFYMLFGGIFYQLFGVKSMFNFLLVLIGIIAIIATIVEFCILIKSTKKNCIIEK